MINLKVDEVDFYLKRLKMRFAKIDSLEYFLSYSGGTDSHLLYWFIKEYLHNDKIQIVGVNTYMEYPEIRRRIYQNCDLVLKPSLKPYEIKEKYGIPCFSKTQDEYIHRYQKGSRASSTLEYINGTNTKSKFKLSKKARELLLSNNLHKVSNKCCVYLKEKPMENYCKESGKKQILGVRGSESILRAARYSSCFTGKGVFTPLYDLTDDIKNKIYERYKIEIPKIYEKIPRTGCVGCPYGSYKGNTSLELSLASDGRKKFIKDFFKESYEVLGVKEQQYQLDIFDIINKVD